MDVDAPAHCRLKPRKLFVLSLSLLLLATSAFAATVSTDKTDYAPGETVTITGSGWLPGETVSLLLQESPATHADRTLTAVADAIGNFINQEFSPEEHDLGVTFTLTATGQSSGFTAQTTFTDSDCGGNLGHLKIVALTGVAGACSGVSAGGGTQSFFVEPGKTYTITFQATTGFECANANALTITAFGQTTLAVRVAGSNPPRFTATITIPQNVCQTSPIRYSCGGQEFFVRRSDETCHQAHLSAATFGPGCTNPDPLKTGDVCRPASGTCDVAEVCGSNGLCPADSFRPLNTVCRAATDVCDVAEVCTGVSPQCPVDVLAPPATVCRASNGVCDVAETCTGTSAVCPSDAKRGNETVCRAAGGVCDVEESCDGANDNCPADVVADTSTVCRQSAGVCDQQETCDGTNVACPADSLRPADEVCRAANGTCDVAEACTGLSPLCPEDAFATPAVVCRDAAGACDAPESCTGTGAACPDDTKLGNGTVCRAAAGLCDVDETCDGASNNCPADAVASSSTVCRPVAGICDQEEKCDGAAVDCPADAFASGTVCRESGGVCDAEEVCSGNSAQCPDNEFLPSTTVCRGAAGVCDEPETCTGSTAACPDDLLKPAGFECRAAGGECDESEACTGNGVDCPVDLKKDAGTACTPDDNVCTLDQCDGTSNHCQHPAGNEGIVCDDDSACTVGDTCQGGVCTGDPAPVKYTGGGQFRDIVNGDHKWSFGFNFRGTIAATASGHFNAVNHTTGLHINGPVIGILCDAQEACGPTGVTFLVRDKKSGCIYRITVEDNREPGAGADRIQIQRTTDDQDNPAAPCSVMSATCEWLTAGNIQRHPPN